MARPRSFDADVAVGAAIETFWRTGYEATSTEQLCAATGLSRGSIYNAFASKPALFRLALERYAREQTDALVARITAPDPLRRRVRAVLDDATQPEPKEPRGCLVVQAVMEFGRADAAVTAILTADRRRRHAALRDAFEAARDAGELAPDADPEALATLLQTMTSGIRVAVRAGAARDELAPALDAALEAWA